MQNMLLALAILIPLHFYAQDSTRLFIPAGKTLAEAVPREKIYQFANFSDGEIKFRDGSITRAKLNYNFLNGEIEFLAPQGDTLAIIKEQMLNIKQIHIDSNYFYFNNGYLRELMSIPDGKLLKREQYKVWKREKIGAYDQPSSTSAIESYSSFVIDGQFQPNLKVMQNVTLVKGSEYYFGNQYLSFLRATKKNLLKTFPKKKEQIENYLKTNEVDFNKEQDLTKLLQFLQ